MNFGQKALQILKTFAPTIALAVGGPVGPFAAAALHAVFGTTDDKSAEAALLGATPQQLADLKKADQDFKTHMADLGVTEDKMAFDDTANARAREIAVRDNTPKMLAYGVIAATLLLEGWIVIHGIPHLDEQMAVVVGRVLGTFDTATALILGYYYGSSKGSAMKDITIANISQK